jgi:CRISPR/Cas system-associated exonuclease Cas4 (RecB family)
MEKLKELLLENFYKSIMKEVIEEEKGENKEITIPVTGLIYECSRRCIYSIIVPEALIGIEGAIRVWIGKKLHETKILEGSEQELELTWIPEFKKIPIKGIIDEYKDGIFIDKKTTRRIPREPYEHHIKQLEYYKVLLEENGRKAEHSAIVYIDVGTTDIQVFPIEFQRSSNEIKEEMLNKYEIISKSLESKILPPRKVRTWEEGGKTTVCQYCNYWAICMLDEIEHVRKPLKWLTFHENL